MKIFKFTVLFLVSFLLSLPSYACGCMAGAVSTESELNRVASSEPALENDPYNQISNESESLDKSLLERKKGKVIDRDEEGIILKLD